MKGKKFVSPLPEKHPVNDEEKQSKGFVAKLFSFLLVFTLFAGLGVAQTTVDDFEDGIEPGWSGDTGSFVQDCGESAVGSCSANLQPPSSGAFVVEYGLGGIQPIKFTTYWKPRSMTDTQSKAGVLLNSNGDFITRLQISGTDGEINIGSSGGYTATGITEGEFHRFVYKNIDYQNNEFDIDVYDSNDNLVDSADDLGFENPSSSVQTYRIDNAQSTTQPDNNVDDISYVVNQEPSFDSVSTSPESWTLGSSVNVSADVVDGDGTVSGVSADVYEDGTQIVSDASLTENSGSWEVDNLFTVDEANVYYNLTLTATDNNGATASFEESQLMENDAPSISFQDPKNQSYFEYSVPLSVSVSDSDDKPGEDWSCTLERDAQQVDSFYLQEGTNSSYSSTVSSDLGQHDLNVSCTDGSGNTGSESVDYSVDDIEFVSDSFSGTVYETEENVYSTEVKTGSMVEDYNVSLVYGQDEVTEEVSSPGVATNQSNLPYRPRLVSSSSESRSFNFKVEYVRETVGGGTSEDVESGSNLSQTVEEGFSTDAIDLGLDFGQSSRTLEKHPFDVSLQVDSHNLSEQDLDLSGTSAFNGTQKNGFDVEYTTGSVNGQVSEPVTGNLSVEFKGDVENRSYSSESLTVDEVVLNENSNGQKVLQLNFYEEEDMSSSVQARYEYNLDTTTSARILDKNFGFEGNSTSTSLYLEPSYAKVFVSGPIFYDHPDYRGREYRLSNQSLGGSTIQQDLFMLRDTVGEPVYFSVTDQAGDPVSGVLQVMRLDGSSGELTTVARRRIDQNGRTLAYLNIDDVYYGYRVENEDGELLKEFEPSIITCATVPCEQAIQVDEGQLDYFSELKGFQYSCGPTTDQDGNFSGIECSVDHEDDLMNSAELEVYKSKGLYEEKVCETNTTNPGTLSCSVSDYEGHEVRYSLKGSTDGFTYTLKEDSVDYSGNMFSQDTPLLGAVVFLSISLLGLRNFGASVIFSVAGVVVSFAFGLLSVSLASVSGLVVVGFIYLFLNRQGR